MSQHPRNATVEILRPEHAKPMVAFLAVALVCGFVFANGLRTPEAVVSILKAGAANVVAGTSLLHEPILGSHFEDRVDPAVPRPASGRSEGGAAGAVPAVGVPVAASGAGGDISSGHAFQLTSTGGNDAGGHQPGGAPAGTPGGPDKNAGSSSGADHNSGGLGHAPAPAATPSHGQGHGHGPQNGHGQAGGTTQASAQDRPGGHDAAPGQAKRDGNKAQGKKKGHDKAGAVRSRGAGRR